VPEKGRERERERRGEKERPQARVFSPCPACRKNLATSPYADMSTTSPPKPRERNEKKGELVRILTSSTAFHECP